MRNSLIEDHDSSHHDAGRLAVGKRRADSGKEARRARIFLIHRFQLGHNDELGMYVRTRKQLFPIRQS
jgi:hypothetical protein